MEGTERLMDVAIRMGSQSVVRTLLDLGESPNAISEQEDSPLMLAASMGRLEIMRMLITSGANVAYAVAGGRKRTAGHEALERGEVRAFLVLLDTGFPVRDYRVSNADNLIFSAIAGESVGAIRVLHENGFDFNEPRAAGRNPLTFAVENKSTREIVANLLLHGASPCGRDEKGDTAVSLTQSLRSTVYLDLLPAECRVD
jgi:ankyrin repeat protein